MVSSTQTTGGFNLVGHLTGRFGLGAAARMTLGVIERNEWPVSVVDVGFTWATGRVPLLSAAPRARLDELPHCVTLLHMNPEQILDGLLVWQPGLVDVLASRLLAAVPYWELPVLPGHWAEVLTGMDCVLAPSLFIRDALERAIDGPNAPEILHFEQAVQPPVWVVRDRRRWFGDRAGSVVFLASFDAVSDVSRKNPWASLEAFRRAFSDRSDVTLALKVGYHDSSEKARASFGALRQAAQGDPRILLITGSLSDSEIWCLHASADVYVSLHRAEGLGLGMMESMSLGVPVIATGYSGNLDFMTDENSVLIPYHLTPVAAESVPVYLELNGVAEWAEPDLDEAARALRRLVENPERRAEIAARALESTRQRWERYERADALRTILERAGHFDPASPARIARIRGLQREVGAYRWSSGHVVAEWKRRVVSTLRAAHLKSPAPPDEIPAGPPPVNEPL